MRSTCFVVLPKGILEENIEEFVAGQIKKYDSNLEVEPYIEFCDIEQTLRTSEIQGFGGDLDGYAEYLKNNYNDAGIENGLLYYVLTYNTLEQWDSYSIRECKEALEIETAPYSVVTLDGVWHSVEDFGYNPVLDFDCNFEIHEENLESRRKWCEFFSKILEECRECRFAILNIHS